MKNKIILYCDPIIEYCLYLLIFALPFSKAGMQIFIGIAALCWIIKKSTSSFMPIRNPLPSTGLNKPLLTFIIVCTLSTILSADFGLSLKALFSKVIKNVLLFFITVETINDKRRLKNILNIIIFSAILLTADTAVQYFRGIDFLRNNPPLGNRMQASFSSPNGFGGWLIVIIPILIGIILSKQFMRGIIKKTVLTGLLVLLLICLAMTYSRASWIGFILSFAFIICYLFSILNIRIRILSIFVLISTVTLFLILPQPTKMKITTKIKAMVPVMLKQKIKDGIHSDVFQKAKKRFASILQIEDSGLLRINLWKESLEIIEDFPLFGIGLNTYSKVAPKYAKAGGGYYPHNSYLQMAAEIGILGLFAFLWIIIKLFGIGMHALKDTNYKVLMGFLAAILAFLTQSFFDVNFYALQLAMLFWLVLGLAVARIKIVDNP